MVSRQMIPVTGDAELERYVSLIPRERAAAPGVSGEHRSLEIGGHEAVYSQIVLDDPSVVAQALIADPVVQAADEIVLVLPFSADRTDQLRVDRKSTRLNSSNVASSYAVFCLSN